MGCKNASKTTLRVSQSWLFWSIKFSTMKRKLRFWSTSRRIPASACLLENPTSPTPFANTSKKICENLPHLEPKSLVFDLYRVSTYGSFAWWFALCFFSKIYFYEDFKSNFKLLRITKVILLKYFHNLSDSLEVKYLHHKPVLNGTLA